AGDPIEGVHIILYEVKKVRGQETLVPIDETCTDGNGEFSFTELPKGKYAVDEDLDLSQCADCGCIDHSGATRISPEGPIYFNITKGDTGGRGRNAGPGEPIYIGQFVNYNIPVVATLEGLKFYDKNANGDWDFATEPLLANWVITLEEKIGNGAWQQAHDMDGNLVEPQVTGLAGTYSFGNLAGDKVYRICEYNWVNLNGGDPPVLDYSYDPVTYTFNLECVLPEDAGWLQTAPSFGDPGPYDVSPPEAEDDVTVDVPCCCFVLAIDPDAPEITTVSSLRFGNTLAELCVEKLDACTELPLAGFEFALYYWDCMTPVEYDGLGNPVTSVVTDETGAACWENLLADDYCVVETAQPGWIPVGPTEQCVALEPGGTATVTFDNWAPCMGLTPGYWKNWRNHYTDAQFEILLPGTIAATIAEADAIFEHWDASPGDELTTVMAFLLANQLTLNLTQHPELPNPSEGSLVAGSSLDCYGTPIVLGEAIEAALDCLANGCSREDLLTIKNWLACFAESRLSTPPCL
ncbi:MAG: hypothetical protein IMF16_01185, partial [Proteobacteria bacterium]|nr:hypothetical protein [Pseudomonadota bacterium]